MSKFGRKIPTCRRCRGTGEVNRPVSRLPGATVRRTCSRCAGRGTTSW